MFRILFVIISAVWAIFVTYTWLAAVSDVPQVPGPLRAQLLAGLVVAVLAALLERAVRHVRAAAGARYRDGYADGYVDGVSDRRPAPERTLRAVP